MEGAEIREQINMVKRLRMFRGTSILLQFQGCSNRKYTAGFNRFRILNLQINRYFAENHISFTEKPGSMQKNQMYFDTSKAKIYKQIYRPSSNLLHLIRTLISVILIGQSPVGNNVHYRIKKSR
jgi:hypothetical protein